MNIENILKYQDKDRELYKIEQKLFNSPYKKKAGQLTSIAKKAQIRSTELENEAEKLMNDISDIKNNYDINDSKMKEMLKKNVEDMSFEEVDKINSLKSKIISNLNILEKMLQKSAENINRILSEFNKTKKTFDEARNQYALCKQKIDEENKTFAPEIAKLKQELLVLEKSVEPELMVEYKKKRNDNIFPVVVPIEANGFCGGCRMELPMVVFSRIKEKGVVVCEHCKRFIYQK